MIKFQPIGPSCFASLIVGGLVANTAQADQHLIQIEQVIGGVDDNLTVQAIQLRMRTVNQDLLSQNRIVAWDAAGLNPVVIIDFTTDIAVATDGARVLIASESFADFTNPTVIPDFIMTSSIPASYLQAGSLTYESDAERIYWRLSWGGDLYTGSTTGPGVGGSQNDVDNEFGPPFPGPLPVVSGQAVLFQGGFADLSTTNEADYALTLGVADFTNNAGVTFTVVALRPGACCDDATGLCEQSVPEADCLNSGRRYGGFDSLCSNIDPPCPGPTGACCDDSTGECTEDLTQAVCEEFGQRYGGDDSTCATIDPPCVEPVGACCDDAVASCTIEILSVCVGTGRRFGGGATDCATIDPSCDTPRGACCDEATGVCADFLSEAECDLAGFHYGGNGSDCASIDPPCEASCLGSSQPATDSIAKLRFLSIDVGDIGQSQAIRVTFLDLLGPYAIWNGTQMWVQEPEDVCENSGIARPPCDSGPTVKAATLGSGPFFMDWSTVGMVAVFHEGIIPDATYDVQVIDQTCGIGDDTAFSGSLIMDTPLWGDCCGPQGAPPDLSVDITLDVTQILDKFKNLEGAISILRADLEPKDVDFVINISDVTFDLNAFSGSAYPFVPSGQQTKGTALNDGEPEKAVDRDLQRSNYPTHLVHAGWASRGEDTQHKDRRPREQRSGNKIRHDFEPERFGNPISECYRAGASLPRNRLCEKEIRHYSFVG